MHLLSNAPTTADQAGLNVTGYEPRFPEDHGSVKIEPLWERWSASLRTSRQALPHCLGLDDLQQLALRRDLQQAAVAWTCQLQDVSSHAGLPAFPLPDLYHDSRGSSVVIATGHQPHVFHCGTIFKYELTAQFAAEQQGFPLSIVMDTDRGDAGKFAYPIVGDCHQRIGGLAVETLTTSPSLFLNARILPPDDIAQLQQSVGDSLASLGKHAANVSFHETMEIFKRLSGVSVTQAHSIARRALRMANQVWELPLSRVCDIPAIRSAMLHVVRDAAAFHTCYNDTLGHWRHRRKIRNRLNPFPSLKKHGEALELPLWAIDAESDERLPIWVEPCGSRVQLFAGARSLGALEPNADDWPTKAQRYQIAPRAALISLLFRTICSDFFLHGLRGRSYDAFTDRLIANYCGFAASPYGVVSISRHLFADEHHQLQMSRVEQAQLRFWEHHPECLLASGHLEATQRNAIARLVDRKSQLLSQIARRGHPSRPCPREHQLLAQVRSEVARIISAGVSTPAASGGSTPAASPANDAIHCRTYPWFFHCHQ